MNGKDEINVPSIVLHPVQWHTIQNIEEMDPISDKDYAVLEEIRQVILRHNFQDRFGVCLLHKHFDMLPGEAALETSDENTRVSTIRIVPESAVCNAVETAWSFAPGADPQAGRRCRPFCQGSGLTGHSRKHECIVT